MILHCHVGSNCKQYVYFTKHPLKNKSIIFAKTSMLVFYFVIGSELSVEIWCKYRLAYKLKFSAERFTQTLKIWYMINTNAC